MSLADKTAVVTGCSRGIGLSIADLLAQHGARIVANSRKHTELEAATSQIVDCLCVPGDVTNPKQAENLINKAIEYHGSVDLLICNVGSGASVPPGKENLEEWYKMFALNFYSAVNVIEAAKPFLKAGASIVCISSICGSESIPGAPITYSTAKAALNSYVKSISRYFGKLGIRINAVAPGNVLFEGSVWESKLKLNPVITQKLIESEVPLGDFATPEDIAEAVLWLSSEKSKFVNGALFTIDGGQTRVL